jgi:hypothetical protein
MQMHALEMGMQQHTSPLGKTPPTAKRVWDGADTTRKKRNFPRFNSHLNAMLTAAFISPYFLFFST